MKRKLFWSSLAFVWLVIVPIQLANYANSSNSNLQVENDIDNFRYQCNPQFQSCVESDFDEYEF
jgi:hypothetical protein